MCDIGLVMKKRYLATRQVREFIATQKPEIRAEYVGSRLVTMKRGKTLETMRAAHEAQAAGIRAQPDFRRVSDEFDVEYAVACQMLAARTQAGLTQADLARRMHTTQSVISRIESGVNVSIETLARFAEACGSRLQVQMVRETGAGYGKR